MKKMVRNLLICSLAASLFWCGALLSDKASLRNGIIRLHVVANSDSPMDQEVKLKVKDEIIASLEQDLSAVTDMDAAKVYLLENLEKIAGIANHILQKSGFSERAKVTLEEEAFTVRYYDTFALPAGVYEALRITIGDGNGKNWWCIAFPGLCTPATSESFVETAASSGFSIPLTKTLAGNERYEIRFYILDLLGRIENHFF